MERDLYSHMGDFGNLHFEPYERDITAPMIRRNWCPSIDEGAVRPSDWDKLKTFNVKFMHWNFVSTPNIFNEMMKEMVLSGEYLTQMDQVDAWIDRKLSDTSHQLMPDFVKHEMWANWISLDDASGV